MSTSHLSAQRLVALWQPNGPLAAYAWVWTYVALVVVLRLYHHLSTAVGLPFASEQLWTEIPLMLAAFASLRAFLRPGRRGAVVAGGLILLVYGVHDYYVFVYGSVPNWRDVSRLPELIGVMPGWAAFLLVLGAVVLTAVVFRHLSPSAMRSWRVAVLLPWLTMAGCIVAAPTSVARTARDVLGLKTWSNLHNVEHRGRIFMSFIREAEYRSAREQLSQHPPIDESPLLLADDELAAMQRRNVHVFVLESFFDISTLTDVKFNRSPMSEAMEALLGQERTTSLSPHFAGGTAKSEFEILCGVPALGLYGFEEFKMLRGAPTYCLPRILRQLDYVTLAFHPFRRSMYNRPLAYRSLGFDHAYFLDSNQPEDRLVNPSPTSHHVLDVDLYEQQFDRIGPYLRSERPVLSYALTMEGHTPFQLDSKRQQAVVGAVTPSGVSEDELVHIFANKTYYRSKALAEHIALLIEHDPNSLIVAVADHLPPVPSEGKRFYERYGYRGRATGEQSERWRENFALVVDRGEVRSHGLIAHHDLYWIILDALSGGRYCDTRPCAEGTPEQTQRKDYLTLLGLGLGSDVR